MAPRDMRRVTEMMEMVRGIERLARFAERNSIMALHDHLGTVLVHLLEAFYVGGRTCDMPVEFMPENWPAAVRFEAYCAPSPFSAPGL